MFIFTAYRIKEGDFESWYIEWLKTAKRIHGYADECLSKGHTISARKTSIYGHPTTMVRLSFYWLSQKILEFKLLQI